MLEPEMNLGGLVLSSDFANRHTMLRLFAKRHTISGNAVRSHGRGRRFEPYRAHHFSPSKSIIWPKDAAKIGSGRWSILCSGGQNG